MKRLMDLVGGLLGPKKTHSHFMESGARALAEGDYQQAEKDYSKALELAEEIKAHDAVAEIYLALATITEHLDRLAVAEGHYRKAYQTYEDNEDFSNAAHCLMELGALYYKQRRLPDAQQVLEYAIAIYQQHFGSNHPGIAESATVLADCLMAERSYAEAEKSISRAIAIDENRRAENDPARASKLHKLGLCYDHQNKDAEAEATYQKAIAFYKLASADFTKVTAHQACACYHDLSRFYLSRNKPNQAAPYLNEAMRLADQYPGYLDEADLADKTAALSKS